MQVVTLENVRRCWMKWHLHKRAAFVEVAQVYM
jgi:hypothetical protein